jgi:hypothetical protein
MSRPPASQPYDILTSTLYLSSTCTDTGVHTPGVIVGSTVPFVNGGSGTQGLDEDIHLSPARQPHVEGHFV